MNLPFLFKILLVEEFFYLFYFLGVSCLGELWRGCTDYGMVGDTKQSFSYDSSGLR